MNLSNLKTYVPAKIYRRGLDYFEQEYVEELIEDIPNRFQAIVSGSRTYEVMVKLAGDGKIVSSFCTCPFESDSLCKHEVAVCLAIREYRKENVSPAVDVSAQLKALKKAELLEILEELVQKQPSVQLYLTEKFANPGGMDEARARRIIRKSVSRASRRGFIEWDRTHIAMEGPEEVLEFVSGLDPKQHAEEVVRLSLIVIQECTELLEMADDSSGMIESMIFESLAVIDQTLAEWPEEVDGTAVDKMLELLYPHIVFGLEHDITDAASGLLEAVLQWNERGDFADKFYDFIERVIGSEEMQDKSYDFAEEELRLHQLRVLQKQGDQEAIDSFYAKHHHYSAVRKAEVRQALEAGGFEKAIRLCTESEAMDAKYAGRLHGWKELRFEAYEGIGNTAELIDLSLEFAAEGEEEYYDKLKSLVPEEQWPEKLEALLAEMRDRPRAHPLYIRILISEKRLEDLLDYCRTNVSAIEQLHPHLLADYPNEVNEIYTNYIYTLVDRAPNRKAYWTACQKIKGYGQALGAEAMAGLIEELKFMYPKRSALLDELGKI